jgi:hypothetical protein
MAERMKEEKSTEEARQEKMPTLMRWFMPIAKMMGYVWVPEEHVQVIYKWTRYDGVRKPNRFGLIKYSGLTETLGAQISTGPKMKRYTIEGLITRDILPVTILIHAPVRFDPELKGALPSVVRILIGLPQAIYPEIADTYFRWVLQSLVSRYNATELMLNEVRVQIENETQAGVAKEMVFLGLEPAGRPRILDIQIPPSLSDRHQIIAQRRANVLAGTEFHPIEFRRALMTEFIESLVEKGVGESIINFQEMFEAYAREHKDRLSGQVVDHPPIQRENPSSGSNTRQSRL